MIKYKIHQIKDIANTDYAFRGYDSEKFCILDYECRYTGECSVPFIDPETGNQVSVMDILEDLFVKFNVNRPLDFKGHSLSMSDVIELEYESGKKELYYCDRFGWKQV